MNHLQHPVVPVANIGEEIGLQLGTQMVHEFVASKSAKELHGFLVGKEILQTILAQPGCQGINFYKAVNELGEHTFVYVGADYSGKNILNVTSVHGHQGLISSPGIVADRIFPRTEKPGGFEIPSGWEWTID